MLTLIAIVSMASGLTRSQHSQQPPEDLWLGAGDRVALPAGSDWVAEGWPEARVVVMQAPAGG